MEPPTEPPGFRSTDWLFPPACSQWGAIHTAAPAIGVDVSPVNVRDAGEIERAVAAFARVAA